MREEWEAKLRATEALDKERSSVLQKMGLGGDGSDECVQLINIAEDPIMSGKLKYPLKIGESRVGKANADTPQDIKISGASVGKV